MTAPKPQATGPGVVPVGLAALVVVVVVVVFAVRLSPFAFAVPLIGVLAFLGVLWRNRVRRTHAALRSTAARLPTRYRWLPAAWLIFTFITVQKFTPQALSGESVSRTGSLKLENVIELSFYVLVAAVLVIQWIPPVRPAGPGRLVLLFAWPVWALLSTVWSLIPAYTLVRSLQLFVPLLLAVFSARVLDRQADDGLALAQPFLRMFINLCTLLAVLAYLFPYDAGGATRAAAGLTAKPQATRLAWYGVQTLVASEILGTAALILAIVGPQLVRLSFAGWFVRLAVLASATVGTQGRGTYVGLLVAVPVAIWTRQKTRPASRALSIGFYCFLGTAVLLLYQHQVFDLATRGEGSERLATLDGRIPLWQLALSQVTSIKDIFLGSGLGASSVELYQQVDFAGHAHNALIDCLLSAGVIGVLLLLVWIGTLAVCLTRRHLPRPLPSGLHAALAATLGLLIVLGVGSPELANPGYSYNVLCFLAVFLLRAPVSEVVPLPHQALGHLVPTATEEFATPPPSMPSRRQVLSGAWTRDCGDSTRPSVTASSDLPPPSARSFAPPPALASLGADLAGPSDDTYPRVVFVAGTLRSGSTLLSRMLGGVPRVATLGEALHTWRALLLDATCSCGATAKECPFWSGVSEELARSGSDHRFEQLARDVEQQVRIRRLRYRDGSIGLPAEAIEGLSEGLRELYLVAARKARADVLLDTSKSPAALPVLLATGLQVEIIHLVRDPRAVAFSESQREVERSERTAFFRPPSRSAVRSAVNWVGMNTLIEQMARDRRVSRYVPLSYEDLASDPVAVSQRLVEEFDLSPELPLLREQGRIYLTPSTTHELAGNPNRFDRGLVPVEVDDQWRVGLTPRNRQLVDLLTLPGRRRYRRP